MNPELVQALDSAAESWVGTPYCDAACVKGSGVTCHLLPYALFRESGIIPDLDGVPLHKGKPSHGKAGRESLMLDWLEGPGKRWFRRVPNDSAEPGTLLLARFGHVPHHLALVLSGGRVVHSTIIHGVQILPVLPASYRRRIDAAFYPL